MTLKYLPDTVPSFEEAIARAGAGRRAETLQNKPFQKKEQRHEKKSCMTCVYSGV